MFDSLFVVGGNSDTQKPVALFFPIISMLILDIISKPFRNSHVYFVFAILVVKDFFFFLESDCSIIEDVERYNPLSSKFVT